MTKPFVLAYVVNRALINVTPDDAKRLTHVNIAFGLVGKDGLLDPHQLTNIDYIHTLRAFNPSLKVVLSVGGWGAGGFSTMALTEEGQRAFAESCREYVEKTGLDGIDIDWEYPCDNSAGIDCDPRDRENFTLLLKALRDALGTERIVSIAAGAGKYFIEGTEMPRVAEICDYVQLMTYDMRSGFCSQAGHHASLYPTKGDETARNTRDVVEMFHEGGVPYEKIVIGAAFYARRWDGVPDVNHGMLQEAQTKGQGGPGYSELVQGFINKNGFTRYWDEDARAPYLFNGSTFISYEDPDSLRAKCEYLTAKGLLGIMYWEHGCDSTHTLLKSIADALER